ncbi:DUF2780 domain-containing protein [Aestuariibacter sp. A3R04]|uniref:DUF2780 domain-containing protein n=1 Tax=Aestuariibacter sp. A3R04 TaxID=2841571 RepID=UPI001C081776|nr:DUF2780 domain-containing protein [Aestuariibacter sp. A3R04]MBU3021213.1 DUF2780 domain-containing protein [Aestuariibacter sp. A3R04]
MSLSTCIKGAFLAFTLAGSAQATTSLQDIAGAMGKKGQTTAQPTASDTVDYSSEISSLLGQVTSNLNVSEKQAEGGLASVFNYVKNNVSTDDFGNIANSIPGLDGLLSAVPSASGSSGQSTANTLSGLMDKASEYSSSVKSVNDIKKQFEALGLTPDMIGQFVSQISTWLNKEDKPETQSLFESGMEGLLSAL